MEESEQVDLVVIGAGTGATGVARMCAHAGLAVVIIDPLPYGGTCALRGCDPKKMLVGVTDALDWATRVKDKGLESESLSIDWSDLMAFKRTFTDVVPDRVQDGLATLRVETLHGEARFTGPRRVQVGDRTIAARNIHLATGARPATLGIPGEELLTSSTAFLELEALPSRIAFVGGGFISFEFAHIARRAGASEVSILHRGVRPLVRFDPDLVDLQVDRTRELGIDVHLAACVIAIERAPAGLLVTVETSDGSRTIQCDVAVHGGGRSPNLDGLDLAAGEVESGPRGVSVKPSMRSTSNSAVFAAGDCADTGAPNLTPVSAFEGRVAAKNIIAGKDARVVDYPPIPSTVFTIPTLAAVGLLEEEADDRGIEFDIHYRRTGGWYSSLRVAETHSAYKILVEKGTGRIVGAHVLGAGAEEQINLFAMAMGAGLTANQIKAAIFAYPTYGSDIGLMV